jgi:hypothetical protein
MPQNLITREKLIATADKSKKPQNWRTHALYSRIYLPFTVVDAVPTGAGNATEAFIVFDASAFINQQSFFSYGLAGESTVQFTPTSTYKPTRADTNIPKAYALPPSTAAALEWISISPEEPLFTMPAVTGAANASVLAAVGMTMVNNQPVVVHDPFSVLYPKEGTTGPQTLHMALYNAIRRVAVLEYNRGAGVTGSIPIAPLSFMPSGEANPYVCSFGNASPDNVHHMPEGLLWGSESVDWNHDKDAQFALKLNVHRNAVIPITLPASAVGAATKATPTGGVLPLMCRVGGLIIDLGSSENSM